MKWCFESEERKWAEQRKTSTSKSRKGGKRSKGRTISDKHEHAFSGSRVFAFWTFSRFARVGFSTSASASASASSSSHLDICWYFFLLSDSYLFHDLRELQPENATRSTQHPPHDIQIASKWAIQILYPRHLLHLGLQHVRSECQGRIRPRPKPPSYPSYFLLPPFAQWPFGHLPANTTSLSHRQRYRH